MQITNEKLNLQLQVLFNKPFEQITDEEYRTLTNLTINSHGLQPEEAEKNIMEILGKCPNLESIRFIETYITKRVLGAIKGIKKLNLEKCAFEDEKEIVLPVELNGIEVIGCFFDNYDGLLSSLPETVETIYFSFPADESTIKANLLEKLKKLRVLILDGCIVDFSSLNLNECEYLSLLNTDIDESVIEKISRLPKLQKLFISNRYNPLPGVLELSERIDVKNDLSEYLYEEPEIGDGTKKV